MSWIDRMLGDEEHIVLRTRPHWRRLIGPAALLVVVAGLFAFAVAAMPGSGAPREIGRIAVAVVAVAVLLRWAARPYLRWRTTHYLLTTERLLLRSGVLTHTGREVPLSRVNDVSVYRTIRQRLFRCGTIVIESGGERGQLVLTDAPDPDRWQRELHRLTSGRTGDERADR